MPTTLIALAFANFAMGTGFLLISGVLPEIAASLGVSLAAAGQLSTIYAIAFAVGAPILVALTARAERRSALFIGMALVAAGTLASALAPNYWVLLAARILTALGTGLAAPTAYAIGVSLVPAERTGRAIAIIFAGMTAAQVAGMPFTTFLAQSVGWRGSLGLVVGLLLIANLVLAIKVPRGIHLPVPTRASWIELMGDRDLLSSHAVIGVLYTGQFMAFAYIAPYLRASAHVGAGGLSLMLFWMGLAALGGSLVMGRVVDRFGARIVLLASINVIAVTIFALPATGWGWPSALIVLALWGSFGYGVNVAQQARVVALAPHATNVALALNTASLYLGQAFGAGLGGFVIDHAGLGALSWVGAAVILASLAILILGARPEGRLPA